MMARKEKNASNRCTSLASPDPTSEHGHARHEHWRDKPKPRTPPACLVRVSSHLITAGAMV